MDNFLSAVRIMIKDIEIRIDGIESIQDDFEKIVPNVTSDIRNQDNEANVDLKCMIAFILRELVIHIYGPPDPAFNYYYHVDLNVSKWSKICPAMEDHTTVAICIGSYIKNWWDLVYDIAHETIHTLNPILDLNVPFNSLEEGVAVKFAEDIFETYLKDYAPMQVACSSPTIAINQSNNYLTAYNAAKKIPNEELKRVRALFGSFGDIDNFENFYGCIKSYVTDIEAQTLFKDFIDPANRLSIDPRVGH